jgi:hypothetical protein
MINVYRASLDDLDVDSVVEHVTKIAAARLAGTALLWSSMTKPQFKFPERERVGFP